MEICLGVQVLLMDASSIVIHYLNCRPILRYNHFLHGQNVTIKIIPDTRYLFTGIKVINYQGAIGFHFSLCPVSWPLLLLSNLLVPPFLHRLQLTITLCSLRSFYLFYPWYESRWFANESNLGVGGQIGFEVESRWFDTNHGRRIMGGRITGFAANHGWCGSPLEQFKNTILDEAAQVRSH